MKKFRFHNAEFSIEKAGYGQYKLSGMGITIHCTDSEIWDECDDEESSKYDEVRRRAYNLIKNSNEDN